MNHKIWGVCDYRRNFLRLQIGFFKEPEIFQHDYFIFSKSHNLGHQKKGFVGTAEGWLAEVPHISLELDQGVHITNHKIWACDYRRNFLRLQIRFCQRSLKSFSFLVSHMIWALARNQHKKKLRWHSGEGTLKELITIRSECCNFSLKHVSHKIMASFPLLKPRNPTEGSQKKFVYVKECPSS